MTETAGRFGLAEIPLESAAPFRLGKPCFAQIV
jgi:hypothetical protein